MKIACSREKAPFYSFSKGKRGIAGGLVFNPSMFLCVNKKTGQIEIKERSIFEDTLEDTHIIIQKMNIENAKNK